MFPCLSQIRILSCKGDNFFSSSDNKTRFSWRSCDAFFLNFSFSFNILMFSMYNFKFLISISRLIFSSRTFSALRNERKPNSTNYFMFIFMKTNMYKRTRICEPVEPMNPNVYMSSNAFRVCFPGNGKMRRWWDVFRVICVHFKAVFMFVFLFVRKNIRKKATQNSLCNTKIWMGKSCWLLPPI